MSAWTRPPLTALVIDDDSFMCELVGQLLQDCGVGEVSSAPDGTLGIAAFDSAEPRPDLVVIDLKLPEQDGFQVVELLAARHYSGGVILISGQEDRVLNSASQMAQFHQLQVLGALAKPLNPAALSRAVARLA